jgi:PAS domain S-box-containing protein
LGAPTIVPREFCWNDVWDRVAKASAKAAPRCFQTATLCFSMPSPAATSVPTLLVEPDAAEAARLASMLGRWAPGEFRIEHVTGLETALARLDEAAVPLIVLSTANEAGDPASTVAKLRSASKDAAIVVAGVVADPAAARACIREGAQEYVVREGLTAEALVCALRNSLARQRNLNALWAEMLEAKAAEARFRNLIVQSADGLLILDRSGEVKFVNTAAERLFGRPASELLGRRLEIPLDTSGAREIDLGQEADATSDGENVDLCALGAGARVFRVRSVRFVSVELQVFETEWAGEPVYVAALHEVTSRRRAEQERLALASISQVLSRDLDLAAVYDRTGDEIAKLIRYDRLEISLTSGGPEDARIVFMRGVDVDGVSVGSRRPAAVRPEFGSWAEAPLGASARPAGYLAVGSRRPGAFREHEVELLERIAAQVFPAVQNARMYARAAAAAGAAVQVA